MTIYERMKQDQLSLRKSYAKTKEQSYKDQATVVNVVVSRLAPSGSESREVDDLDAIALIRSFINANIDTLHNLAASDRDHVKAENENIILQTYLPKQLTEEDIENIASDYIKEHNLSGMPSIKFLKNHFEETYAGCYDKKKAGEVFKKLL